MSGCTKRRNESTSWRRSLLPAPCRTSSAIASRSRTAGAQGRAPAARLRLPTPAGARLCEDGGIGARGGEVAWADRLPFPTPPHLAAVLPSGPPTTVLPMTISKPLKVMSFKVGAEERAILERVSADRHVTLSEVIRTAIRAEAVDRRRKGGRHRATAT